MRFIYISALILLAVMPEFINGGHPWIARKTTESTTTAEPTTVSPTTEEPTTVSPTPADLETTMKHIYPSKKTKRTMAPTPSVAALESTTELLSSSIEPESTSAPILETSSQLIEESTSLLPSTGAPIPVETSSQAIDESSSLPPSTDAPTEMATSSAAPDVESSAAPEAESTTAEEPMSPGVETSMKPDNTDRPVPTKKETAAPTLPPIDFNCRRKDDGYYANPKDKCSSHFYACVGGMGRRMECGSSDLVYEPDTGLCERRQDSFRCTGTRKTTLPSTPRPPPPPTAAKLPIDCSKYDQDGWFPDPLKKCSHVFYSCSNGIGSKFECPGHMYFDVESKGCQAFQDVFACAGKKPPTKKLRPTTPAGPIVKLPIDCADKPSGHYADPEKKCSQVYYVCSNGDGFKRTCPDGLYFSARRSRCDFHDEIFACTGRTKPATKATPAPKPSEASLPSKEFNCKDKKDGTFTPEHKKCSRHYFRCVGGVTYKLHCQKDLYYDVENDLCERWMDLFVCSGKKPTSPLPTTTTQPKPTEKLPIDCSKYSDGDFQDPEKKCSRIYYSCSSNVGTRRLCPETTYFDKNFGICDIKDNVPACSGKPRPVTTELPSTARLPTTKLPYNCEKRGDGNYPAGKCANYYWSCVGGSTGRASCPHGTYYDTEMDECGYKHEIPACGGVRPTTQKP